jgi:hypothetical protein
MDAQRAPTFNAQSKNIFTRQCNASGDGQDLGDYLRGDLSHADGRVARRIQLSLYNSNRP